MTRFVLGSAAAVLLLAGAASGAQPADPADPAVTGKASPGPPHQEMNRLIASATGPFELTAAPVQVEVQGLRVPGGAPDVSPLIRQLAARRRIVVVLRGIRAAAPPGVLFHLYFDLPAGAEPAADDPRHVGVLNFYEAVSPPGTLRREADALFTSYDISAAVRTLAARGQLVGPTTVTFRAAGAPDPGSHPTVGRIEVVAE
jgi:hypothetical protein